MPRVKQADLQEGMVVSADVRNMDDMLLIPAGCPLTSKHIEILQSWGISDVHVESPQETTGSTDLLESLPPEELSRLSEEMRSRFWRFDDTSSVQQEVLKQVIRRLVKQPRPA
jgi:hypothetical protein